MKRLENELKTSFSKSPYDRIIEDNEKNILKAFSHSQVVGNQEEVERNNMVGEILSINLPHVSAIPVNQGSAISAGSAVEEWFEEV